MHIEIAVIAYVIDLIFGELPIRHPVAFMGDFIYLFEKRFYKDSGLRGALLTLSVITMVYLIAFLMRRASSFLPYHLDIAVLSVISGMGIAGNMLYDSVKGVLMSDNPKKALSMLVSRDTKNMSKSDIYKACIETYAENLSDGVIAPLFYLLLFNIEGLFIYKAINTLDSMVGYKTERYSKFGKFSAIADDVVNYIPARLTAFIIALLSFSKESFRAIFLFGNKHESPNAGYPISAMAGALSVALGGNTFYNGELKKKPYFNAGRKEITEADVKKMLRLKWKIDSFIIGFLMILYIIFSYIYSFS